MRGLARQRLERHDRVDVRRAQADGQVRFAAGEGVTADYRQNWAECCAKLPYTTTIRVSSSTNTNIAKLATTVACLQHSSDTGSGGDCSTYGGMSPQQCCSKTDGEYDDPMCVFDYCLNKLSPHS